MPQDGRLARGRRVPGAWAGEWRMENGEWAILVIGVATAAAQLLGFQIVFQLCSLQVGRQRPDLQPLVELQGEKITALTGTIPNYCRPASYRIPTLCGRIDELFIRSLNFPCRFPLSHSMHRMSVEVVCCVRSRLFQDRWAVMEIGPATAATMSRTFPTAQCNYRREQVLVLCILCDRILP